MTAAALAAATVLGLAGCGAEEPPADVAAVPSADAAADAGAYAGPYDQQPFFITTDVSALPGG